MVQSSVRLLPQPNQNDNKLQNSIFENHLNSILTEVLSVRIFRRSHFRWVGGARTWNRVILYLCVAVEELSHLCRYPRRASGPNPVLGSPAQCSITPCCEKGPVCGWIRSRASAVPGIPLKVTTHRFTTDSLTHYELRHWGSMWKSTRDQWGGAKLSGSKARAGGVAFSQTKM